MRVGENEKITDHRNLLYWSDTNNDTNELPLDMQFNDGHVLSIIVYSILMVFSAVGNITILVLIVRRRRQSPSRITTTLMHLAIADLLVTFIMMPLEIAWSYTVQWEAGDLMCRIMMFFRMFGLCLSSFILVCISLDRYYAVLKPLHLTGIDRRGRYMLIGAWLGAAICSMPQALVFEVRTHPNITNYVQCITYNTLQTHTLQVVYAAFGTIVTYIIPLIVIIYSYVAILIEIFKRTNTDGDRIRRSSLGFLGRAKIRTLKMTIIIVLVFFICWTPYNAILVFFWYDRDQATKLDPKIQRGLFLFACTNSCMNPIVYGVFNIRAKRANTQVRMRLQTLDSKQTVVVQTPTVETLVPGLEISLRPLE
ncbi:adipokinetic hormone/corazonin-related peptide receptor variant I-like isoform X2 [Onthophagus taurus]|uniref:adipokinetic hormone/corazonin-related peptide receptor variant I-like isoform X2 n=1 Tax=Onthophagus taurus TaxID=166361 RepID=UPI000C20E158|nr:gonadotropin-releasing hormone II receptor-like [Onthophagus taurus]